jgi:two-component system response regulator NreC
VRAEQVDGLADQRSDRPRLGRRQRGGQKPLDRSAGIGFRGQHRLDLALGHVFHEAVAGRLGDQDGDAVQWMGLVIGMMVEHLVGAEFDPVRPGHGAILGDGEHQPFAGATGMAADLGEIGTGDSDFHCTKIHRLRTMAKYCPPTQMVQVLFGARGHFQLSIPPRKSGMLAVEQPLINLVEVKGVPVRILIAEDQQLVRQGLAALLKPEDVEIVGEAEDGEAAVAMARSLRPDIVLMDLTMPVLDGVEATRRIKRLAPQVRVLVLTVANCERRVAEALAAGADGYALKRLGHGELMAAITSVRTGKSYLGPGIDAELVKSHLEGGDANPVSLTGREGEVLRLIAQGLKNREIADSLSIAVKTVETHRTKIMQKLDLHNSAELATYAIRRGLID